jgi:hypothetical protein
VNNVDVARVVATDVMKTGSQSEIETDADAADLKRKFANEPDEGQENEKKFKGNDYRQSTASSQPAADTIVNTKPNFATFAENQCYNCQQIGHRSKECPEKKVRFECSSCR